MHPRAARLRSWAIAGLGLLTLRLEAAAPAGGSLFDENVRPLLEQKCFGCHSHSADRIQGGLVLDSRSGALQGGDSGSPAVVPHDPAASALLERVRTRHAKHRMPAKGEPLTREQIALLEQWIRQGAPWPEANPTLSKRPRGPIQEQDRAWWAFQPLKPTAVPRTQDSGWARNDIDRFILQKLAPVGLTPTPEARRTVLIRRLYFDLWGLPPAPADIDAFVQDTRPDAYEQLVDRLLASPHYGERWARHWLDLVRYADSDGYKADDFRPTAWRYRDYVIRALNSDKPYNRFVQEQLAGDELFPNDPDALAATGYLRNGIYEYNNRDAAGQWTTILNDITDTTGDVFFGLGFQCARCHDHKFDPILQKDYFRLQAFFAGIQWHDELPLADAATRAEQGRRVRAWEEETGSVRQEIETLLAPYKANAAEGAISKFPPAIQAILRKPESERSPLERQLGALAYRQVSYEHDRLIAKLKPADKDRYASLQRGLAEYDALRPPPLPVTLTVRDVGPVAPPVFIPRHPEDPVAPGFPSVLDPEPAAVSRLAEVPDSTGRRAALAAWLTRPENPLITRVLVNRVWQYHFGRGLVGTASDLGRLGERPSHPELLDWMARRFIADGWSLKALHRLILTSATYRQASSPETADGAGRLRDARAADLAAAWKRGVQLDPENRLLWRGQTRRLDAEQIRDSLLSATGELKPEPVEGAADASQFRRSIYSKVLRNTRDPLLDVFDTPQQFSSTASRDTTTTPVQSLLLINSPFMLQRSRAMAARLNAAAGDALETAVEQAYLAAFGRRPHREEQAAATEFIRQQQPRVDPELALSATAGFQSDRMPFRDGRAAVLAPRTPQETLSAPLGTPLPSPAFTLEAFVYLRSLPDDGSPRVIAAMGDALKSGWALGVTGRKSTRRPQVLMIQLARSQAADTPAAEEVFSDLVLSMDKPYYVGVTISGTAGERARVTFHLKDLSNDEEPLQTVQIQAGEPWAPSAEPVLTLGGRKGGQWLWDGLIDEVRFTGTEVAADRLQLVREGALPETVGLWSFEPKPSYFRDGSGRGHDLRPTRKPSEAVTDARLLALADFCHVLLNSNEYLYLE